MVYVAGYDSHSQYEQQRELLRETSEVFYVKVTNQCQIYFIIFDSLCKKHAICANAKEAKENMLG